MAHKMGLVRLNPTTKNVATTLTYTYNQVDGGYTSSTSGTSTITASNDFTGNKPYAINSQYWHIVKSTGISTNTAMEFTCNANQKDYWSAKSSGTDVGHGKYKVIDIQSDREAANFVALFSCVGKCQEITLPWYDTYKMECWGANGGSTDNNFVGKAGYTSGNIILSKEKKLYVYVGESGHAWNEDTQPRKGGWNGGGDAVANAGGGGGATDIRMLQADANISEWNNTNSMRTRIMVAAGGGGYIDGWDTATGASRGYSAAVGGHAGGLRALPHYSSYSNGRHIVVTSTSVSTQTSGQTAQYSSQYIGENGAFGKGGNAAQNWGGGGAGGWYGGAGGCNIPRASSSSSQTGAEMPGGGGSSFISGHPGCNGVNSSGVHRGISQPSTILINSVETEVSFIKGSTQMIDGSGKEWTTESQTTGGNSIGIPSKPEITSNGYAKIISQ